MNHNDEFDRPSYIRKLGFTALFLATNALYFSAIYGSIGHVVFCCDATSYVNGSRLITEQGFDAAFFGLGYRSYLNFALVAMLRAIGTLMGEHREWLGGSTSSLHYSAPYAIGAMVVYAITAILVIWRFGHQPRFWTIFVPLFCNPFLSVYVPVPLQEGQAVIVLLPLAAWALLALHSNSPANAVAASSLMAGICWMLKSSYLIPAAAIFAFVIIMIWRTRTSRIALSLSAACLFAMPVLPQIASMMEHFGSLNPYPRNEVLQEQLHKGWSMWRYDTWFDPATGTFRGLAFPAPFGNPAVETFDFRNSFIQQPATGLALAVGHTFAAFSYANIRVYAERFHVPPFSLINLVAGAIIFLGVIGAFLAWTARPTALDGVLIDGMILGFAAVLPVIAVESRYGIVSFAFLSVRAAQLTLLKLSNREIAIVAIGTVMFSVAFVLIGTLMFQTTGLSMQTR